LRRYLFLEADLEVPSQDEKEELRTVKEDIKCQSSRSEQLALKPVFSHWGRMSKYYLACRKKEKRMMKEERGPAKGEWERENKGGGLIKEKGARGHGNQRNKRDG